MRSAGLPLTIGYTSHLWDRALGQYAAPFRYYNPATARWNMRDPLGFVDGPNVYAYVVGNPVSSYDSLGLDCKKKSLIGRYRDRINDELDKPHDPGKDPARPSSANRMEKELKDGAEGGNIAHVHPANPDVPGSKAHVHYKNGTAHNWDGTPSHKGKGTPKPDKDARKFLEKHHWHCP